MQMRAAACVEYAYASRPK